MIGVNLDNLFLETELPDFDRKERKLVSKGKPFDSSVNEPNVNELELLRYNQYRT